jgi:hypothetical protein
MLHFFVEWDYAVVFGKFPVKISAGSFDTSTIFHGFPGPSIKYRDSA